MLILAAEGQFKRDVKLAKKRGKALPRLWAVIETLQKEESLSPKHRPHPLKGIWSPAWECHIEPDWLLVYHVSDGELRLIRTGTHADLFD